jgi:di/tricarboxylate transporter
VSSLQDSAPPDFARAPFAFAILIGMLLVASFEWVPLFQASFIAAGLMVATGCVTLAVARRSIEYPVLAGIAASFALGFALAESGAAAMLAEWIGGIAKGDPFWALVVLYVATVILTELITNNAAGVLMFPIAMAAAGRQCSPAVRDHHHGRRLGRFITPIGHQTNLAVAGPGGYRWADYIRFGTPLSFLVGIATVLIVPRAGCREACRSWLQSGPRQFRPFGFGAGWRRRLAAYNAARRDSRPDFNSDHVSRS